MFGERGRADDRPKANYELSGHHMSVPQGGCWFSFATCPSKKLKFLRFWDEKDQHDPDEPYYESDGLLSSGFTQTSINSSGEKPQDADYSNAISLSYELQALILARVPRSEYWKLFSLDRRCVALLKNGDLFKIRREIGFVEPSIFMSASGGNIWWTCDRDFKSCTRLPDLPSDDICFISGDKESLCAGTHLLVAGRELEGCVIYRFELATNQWEKGPSMITPRCLFASATCGDSAYVAGGVAVAADSSAFVAGIVTDSAEKYDPDSGLWTPLPGMNKRRKLCSGCYMDNKFYVIGGRNEDGELTCGEYFDVAENKWELIPDMLKDDPVHTCHAPPLIAVVNNELYSLEASTNQLKVYMKKSNTWKQLGTVPVEVNSRKGWGVAFKSLGNELLVIGSSATSMDIFICCPEPDANKLHWRPVDSRRTQLCHFLLNCSVMMA